MDAQGQFNTRGNAPEWLAAHNLERPIEKLHDKRWLAMGAEGTDLKPLRRLTYDPQHPEEFFALYQSSPFCQDAQFELLHTLLTAEKMGQSEGLDFVFVTLGSMALLGYETGSDSSLMGQMALHLDRQIQRTLDVLNKAPGKDKYNLIFAAAHGAPPDPDPALRSQKDHALATRFPELLKSANELTDRELVTSTWELSLEQLARAGRTTARPLLEV